MCEEKYNPKCCVFPDPTPRVKKSATQNAVFSSTKEYHRSSSLEMVSLCKTQRASIDDHVATRYNSLVALVLFCTCIFVDSSLNFYGYIGVLIFY